MYSNCIIKFKIISVIMKNIEKAKFLELIVIMIQNFLHFILFYYLFDIKKLSKKNIWKVLLHNKLQTSKY